MNSVLIKCITNTSNIYKFRFIVKDFNNNIILDEVNYDDICVNLDSQGKYSVTVMALSNVCPNYVTRVFNGSDCEVNLLFYLPSIYSVRPNRILVRLTDYYYDNLPIEKGMINFGNLQY